MSAHKKLLPFVAALALANQGVKIPSFYGYVHLIEQPDPRVTHLMRHSPNTDYSVLEKLGIGFCPAPTFEDIWAVLPPHLGIGELQLKGIDCAGNYTACYSDSLSMQGLIAPTPVAAAGQVLLEILEMGLISADRINQLAQLSAQS